MVAGGDYFVYDFVHADEAFGVDGVCSVEGFVVRRGEESAEEGRDQAEHAEASSCADADEEEEEQQGEDAKCK
jgi:hypothetical protein